MFKVGGWLKSHAPTHTKSLDSLNELAQIQDAMSAVTYIMNDDLESAEKHLGKGTSPFHQLGVGVCMFMRATLGFEQESMREASNTLYQAECAAYEIHRRAAKDPNAYQSPIYPPGTEYAVCQAEAQLMSAVVGLLNESLTEAIKSFYKLRKAYLALEGVMENERKFLSKRSTTSVNSAGFNQSLKGGSLRSTSGSVRSKMAPGLQKSTSTSAAASTTSLRQSGSSNPIPQIVTTPAAKKEDDDDDEFDFEDAEEDHKGNATPAGYMGHLNTPGAAGVLGTDTSSISDHPIDAFILAGSNFCFGMLLLLLSFVPPTFAPLLKIVGFKGDRERGMQMLWKATQFHDIHGAMAGVVLMGYLNGFSSICDIIVSTGEGSYPKERCKALLRIMRERYPKSHLWLVEESRMLAHDRELETAVKFVTDAGESPLRQLEALSWFERSLNNMYMHDYKATAIAFQKCIELNNWSHGLYWYICGAAYVELYRQNKVRDPATAQKYAIEAKEFFDKVVPNIGKKKFMGRQLPFDLFVNRKIQKWEARAKEWNCDFMDAIGVSPLEEMIFFWNGAKRMRMDHLETSLENLAWSESPANPHWDKEGLDEKSVLSLLRASTLRNMDRTAEAKAILEKDILPVDTTLFKGELKDSWTAPCARYEMAANVWREADVDGQPTQHMDMLNECRDWLKEVTSLGGFDLDARIGMKVTTGNDTLRKLGVQY